MALNSIIAEACRVFGSQRAHFYRDVESSDQMGGGYFGMAQHCRLRKGFVDLGGG